MEGEYAIQLCEVSKRYGSKAAVDRLNLQVKQGEVFGFAGENAAGKTTTIRMLLGHVKPTSGTISVLGHNPADSTRIHHLMAQLGYVSESRGLYDWMRVHEIIGFCAGVHGQTWDSAFAEQLRDDYGLDPQIYVRHLSNGKRALLMLLLATSHHPQLLVLDEPSSGLDPVARHEILEHVINVVKRDGRTVFFSSHLLDEVDRVADRVGFMKEGRLVALSTPAGFREKWRRVYLSWPEVDTMPTLPFTHNMQRRGDRWVFVTDSYNTRLAEELFRLAPDRIHIEEMTLNEIFVEAMSLPQLQPMEHQAFSNALPAA